MHNGRKSLKKVLPSFVGCDYSGIPSVGGGPVEHLLLLEVLRVERAF